MNNYNASFLQLLSLNENSKYKIESNFIDNLYSNNIKTDKVSIRVISKNSSRWGSVISYIIPKEQDLLSNLFLYISLPSINLNLTNLASQSYGFKWVDYIGMKIIKSAELYIGNRLIDKYDSLYTFLYSTIYDSNSSKDFLLGLDPVLNNIYSELQNLVLYIPINFWFSSDLKNALPLTNHDDNIEIKIYLNDWNNCYQIFSVDKGVQILENINIPEIKIDDIYLICNYILLDKKTHEQFIKEEFDILITQNQLINNSLANNTFELKFNNLVKEIWFVIQNKYIKYNLKDFFNLTNFFFI